MIPTTTEIVEPTNTQNQINALSQAEDASTAAAKARKLTLATEAQLNAEHKKRIELEQLCSLESLDSGWIPSIEPLKKFRG